MSAVTDLNRRCMDSLMQLKSLSNLGRKRWHLAFATIFSLRAFSRPNKSSKPPHYMRITPENCVIDILPPAFPNVSQSSLTRLVQDKDLEHLDTLGGVEGLDVEHGLLADSDDIKRRQEAFGINTYPRQPERSFFSFARRWEYICSGFSSDICLRH
ncbi:hypothetical protein POM88_026698 [Heracleum sosnowskyi]|uniref:Cation-transporting P-type ATPase N-terminal domain-containing protein n=1 Tax=Heracleum sosnowskyi TaxID=360622 RepID=A0AAD8MPH6_9APIA|nr:hypothetical protein POM88_026698 [Heracleum sosnowskyi]